MNPNSEEFKQLIYDLMNGSRNLEEYPVKENQFVVNEFEHGKFCNMAYQNMYNANQRLCRRLNSEEDSDVECIISNLLDMQYYLCMKMYDYGAFFSQRQDDSNEKRLLQLYRNLDETKRAKFMELVGSLEKCLCDEMKG